MTDDAQVPVTFQPLGRTISVPSGATIALAVTLAGAALETPCGGNGTCGKCRVRVAAPDTEPNTVEREHLSPDDLARGIRLACQQRVFAPTTVETLDGAHPRSGDKILVDSAPIETAAGRPSVVKRFVTLLKPTLDDDLPDLDRLHRELGPFDAALDLLREFPTRLRDTDFAGTAVFVEGRMIDFEPGNTESERYSVVFDIGTTTLVGMLINAGTGQESARTSRMNPQTRFGDDVVSRILHVRQNERGLAELQAEIICAVNEMIRELSEAAHVPPERIYEIAFSGNSTMQSLLTGVNPSALGELPFVPASGGSIRTAASDLGIAIHPRGRSYVFPIIGGFLGGDTVSGALITRLDDVDGPTMLVDIGTNGEIVLYHDGQLTAASCAAGPAFEGARITHGMRAARGAIEEVAIEHGPSGLDVKVNVIGAVSPVGLCGSALIDVAAELLRHGILDPGGLLLPPDTLPPDLGLALRERVVVGDEGVEFVLVSAAESQTGKPITISQQDIRQFQLATAAIRAGYAILLKRAGIEAAGLDHFYIAGAFGNYIRPHNAQRLGLLPHDLDPNRFEFAGNTSLAGARLAAVSLDARERAEALAQRIRHLDLSLDLNFQTEYVEAMFFPYSEA